MTEVLFNAYQLKLLEHCFSIVDEEIEANYRKCVRENMSVTSYEKSPAHWRMLVSAVNNYTTTSGLIQRNEINKTNCRQWQEIMFLIETVHNEFCREVSDKSKILRSGLMLLIGMFRNQFPGERWNPDDVRWTTVGEAGERGVSPMLMAITEL